MLIIALYRMGRRARFFAHEGAYRRPILGWFLHASRQAPVYRGLGTDRATVAVREALDAGQVVVGYPEGTIPEVGECPPARPGVGLVALRCRVPVIPATLWGMKRRADTKMPRLGLRQQATVVFGAS